MLLAGSVLISNQLSFVPEAYRTECVYLPKDISKVSWSDFCSLEQLPILNEVDSKLKKEIYRDRNLVLLQPSSFSLFINVNP